MEIDQFTKKEGLLYLGVTLISAGSSILEKNMFAGVISIIAGLSVLIIRSNEKLKNIKS